jgi:ribonucleoside-diphosphate reductase alpha chain
MDGEGWAHAARRQKWIDMGQTLTLGASEKDIGQLAAFYMQAWENGIKTVHQVSAGAMASEEIKTVAAGVLAG